MSAKAREPFDPNTMNVKDLKHQPVEVIKTEVPSLARALGMSPAELLRALTIERADPRVAAGGDECCTNDSW